MTALKFFTWSILVISIIALVVVAFFVTVRFQAPSAQEFTTVDNYSATLVNNPSFSEGMALYKQGAYDPALARFDAALSQATNDTERGLIAFRIALTKEQMGDYQGSIENLHDIIINPEYSRMARAYAAQEIALMLYKWSDMTIVTPAFSREPLKSMYVPGDVALSIRKVLDFSSGLYPLANTELRIADWYAWEIFNKRVTAEQANAYKSIIRQKLAAADEDIARIRQLPNEVNAIPTALTRKAVVIAKMQASGDTSFGDYDDAFRQALNVHALSGPKGGDGYLRFYYAFYIATIDGSIRTADIHTLMSPIYESSEYVGSSAENFFKTERTNLLSVKSSLVLIASHDSGFKKYLMGLGWRESDFTIEPTS